MVPGTVPMVAGGAPSGYALILDSTTWTVPDGVTNIRVMLTAAGGSGGARGVTTIYLDGPDEYIYGPGGDGGHGGCVISNVSVTSGQNITVTVGQSPGGGRIPANADGYTGGSSSFLSLSASGGLGGITYSGTSYLNRSNSSGSGGNLLNSHAGDSYISNTFFPDILNNWSGPVSTSPLESMRDQYYALNYVNNTSVVDWDTNSIVASGVGGGGGNKTLNGVYYVYGRGAAHGMCLIVWGGNI